MTPDAEEVRNAYRLRRQMYQPKWNPSSRWETCWERTATLIALEQLDLSDYMDAQFKLKAPFPMPNQLYSSEALARYKAYRVDNPDPVDDVYRWLEIEMDFFETRLGMGFSIFEVFVIKHSPLSPLFCYCVAVIYGEKELAKMFEERAQAQAASSDVTAKVYRALLPEGAL